MPDFTVSGGGSIYIVEPLSEDAKDWVDENVGLEAWQWWGNGFTVEHRYIGDLVEGMLSDGLVLAD